MIIPDTGDPYGQLLAVLTMMALLAYLAPGMMSLSPVWARRLQAAAIVFLGIALAVAVIATIAWFAR